MLGSNMLEIGMGLMLVYLVLSLVCTALNEFWANLVKGRHLSLKKGLRLLLEDGLQRSDGEPGKVEQFFDHDLIKKLGRKPSYIAPQTFARVLSDLLVPATPGSSRTIAEFRTAIEALDKSSQLRRPLLLLLESAGSSLAEFQQQLETWFNEVMDRVAGWYKRKIQLIVMLIAVVVAFAANADTFAIADALSRSDTLRKNLVTQAEELVSGQGEIAANLQQLGTGAAVDVDAAFASARELDEALKDNLAQVAALNDKLGSFGLPLGWQPDEISQVTWRKLLGLLITALAISLGAPFWFEMLRKVANIRAAGTRPDGNGKPK